MNNHVGRRNKMKKIHNINEDYEHYRNRKQKENKKSTKWILIIFAIFIIVFFLSSLNTKNKAIEKQDMQNNPEEYLTIYCGMPYETLKGYMGGEPIMTDTTKKHQTPALPDISFAFWEDDINQFVAIIQVSSQVVIGIEANNKDVMRCRSENGKWITTYQSNEAINI